MQQQDGTGGHYPKENKSEKNEVISYHFYVEAKKYNKLVNTTQQKPTYRYREQIRVYQSWGKGRGNSGMGLRNAS